MIAFDKIDQKIRNLRYDSWTPIVQVLQLCYDIAAEARKRKDWAALEIIQETLLSWVNTTNKSAISLQEPSSADGNWFEKYRFRKPTFRTNTVENLMKGRTEREIKKLLATIESMLLGRKQQNASKSLKNPALTIKQPEIESPKLSGKSETIDELIYNG